VSFLTQTRLASGQSCAGARGTLLLQVKSPNDTIAFPATLAWHPQTLHNMRNLLNSASPPEWAASLRDRLLKAADKAKSLNSTRAGSHSGPWSPLQKSWMPPSGDKQDFASTATYKWPCTTTCEEACKGLKKCPSCKLWKKAKGSCNQTTGLPWVSHDGFNNRKAQTDHANMVAMTEHLNKLVLGWWFCPSRGIKYNCTSFAEVAVSLVRAWFLNETTRMNPNTRYAASVPGQHEGKAGGLIAFTHRWGALLNDCIALLQLSGPSLWTNNDEKQWKSWRGKWFKWLSDSDFGKEALRSPTNHGTNFFVHALSMAFATRNETYGLSLIAKLKEELPGSLAKQIRATGEMPHETARVASAGYSIMNLRALFELGHVVESICHTWKCGEHAWNWDFNLLRTSPPGPWQNRTGAKLKCNLISGKKERGDKTSKASCLSSCLEDECNAVNMVEKKGKIKKCRLRVCRGDDFQFKSTAAKGLTVRTAYYRTSPPEKGSGSVKEALEYLLRYAVRGRDWEKDHGRSKGVSWPHLAPILRAASVTFGDAKYEKYIKKVDPDQLFSKDYYGLVMPPLGTV